MTVTTRRQRAQRKEFAPYPSRSVTSPCNQEECHHLPDGTVVRVTVSATGKGKHWRWVYPEDDSDDLPLAQSKPPSGLPPPPSLSPLSQPASTTIITAIPPFPQRGKLITPVSTMQHIIPGSIQNAPRKRLQEKYHRRRLCRPEGAPSSLAAKGHVVQREDTIPWEKDLKVRREKRTSPRVGPQGQALGPHGTWLVNEKGECVVYPVRKSSRLRRT